MPTTDTMGTNSSGYYLDHTTSTSGDYKVLLKTENKFVDKDIAVTITTPAASSPTLAATNNTSGLNMGTASGSQYSPIATITGNANIATAGWITAGNHSVSAADVVVGKVNQSKIRVDGVNTESGATVKPKAGAQTITITEGYNTERTLTFADISEGPPAAITSGAATNNSVTYEWDSTSENYKVTHNISITKPTVNTAGYISSTKGTGYPNSTTLTTSIYPITLGTTLSGTTSALKPTLTKQAISIIGVVDAASGDATSTAPGSGVYVAIRSNTQTGTITASPYVAVEGYGDETEGHYMVVDSGNTKTVGAAQSDIYYVPITTTTATRDGRTVSYGSGWITAGSTSVPLATVTSGAGTAIISTPTYDSTSGKFIQTATGTIAAPTVGTAGYISSSEGTKNTNNISGSKELDVIGIGVTLSPESPSFRPTISKQNPGSGDTWINAASGSSTTTKPTSGAYVAVSSSGNSISISATPEVTSAGYGTATRASTTTNGVEVEVLSSIKTYVPITAGTVTSGSATISSATFTYNSTSGKFDVTGSADVSAPTFTEGYIASNVGTISANTDGATLSTTVNKIELSATISSVSGYEPQQKPVISLNSNGNINAGSAVTTKPSSGYYVAVRSASYTAYVRATPSVSSAGYGTASYNTARYSSNYPVGAQASAITYIPITSATFANTATSGTTYTDISSTAPVLISGDYLYINEGYTGNSKISLAKLVPDATGTNASAQYILSGYTAFDNNGGLIIGTMQTYDGTYEVV